MQANFINLAELDGSNGFLINKVNPNDYAVNSVSNAGDVNGDGIDDIIIGTSGTLRDGKRSVGEAYVIFGRDDIGSSSVFELSELNGANGFTIKGVDELDRLGSGVSNTDDINGDGFDDIVIGASGANTPNDSSYSYSGGGANYVIFGGANVGNSGSIEVADINSGDGFAIDRTDPDSRTGSVVDNAGDVNGDGFDDFIVTQDRLLLNFIRENIKFYVVFGGEDVTNLDNLNLSDVDGNNGFFITGVGGRYVTSDISNAGDVNGDGFDDLVVTSYENETVVVFGEANLGTTGNIDFLNLDSNQNQLLTITVNSNNNRYENFNVGNLGDVNGDGIDDLAVSSRDNGIAVIFGNPNLDEIGDFNFTELDGSNGFIIDSNSFTNYDSIAVSNGGDFDGDGFDDLVINSPRGDKDYLIFGSSNLGRTGTISISDLDEFNSLIIGIDSSDYSSKSVSNAGDINGDGLDDLLVSGYSVVSTDAVVFDKAVVFGRDRSSLTQNIVGTSGNDTLNGTNNGETINALAGDDSVVAFGGNDTINGGSGQDTLFGNSGNDNILGGDGNDVLWGQQNDDSIAGERGSDRILGNSGNDTLLGGSDSDTISGGDGNDSLQGNSGDDRLNGNNGDDTIWGGLNNDLIFAGTGADRIFGGEGNDTLWGQGGTDILVGGAGSDLLNGDRDSDTLLGGQDSDRLSGNAGNDSLVGEAGNDRILGNSGSDTLVGGEGNDTLFGGLGNDFFTITRGENTDLIKDFIPGQDKFVLGSGLSFNDLTFVQAGRNGEIRFTQNGVNELLAIVENIDVADLNAFDFRGISNAIDLANLNGSNGFVIQGIDPDDFAGRSVSGAGDVNGDGIDDIILSAPYADAERNYNVGETYVIFGEDNLGNSGTIQLSNINGNNGFVLNGIDFRDYSGRLVSDGGDINGDGFGDIIISAPFADPNGKENAGVTYVVFGGNNLGNSGSIELAELNGNNGFILNGIDEGDFSGNSIGGAGDINDDGFADIIVGASFARPNGTDDAGETYVVFGGNNVGNSGSIELAELNGNNGFVLNGVNIDDFSGSSASIAGDFNNDGIDDFVIGAPSVEFNESAGQTYVVFGKNNIGNSGAIELSELDGNNGFVINGIDREDLAGQSVSNGGDINGDGIDDLLIGAPDADPNGKEDAGESYVVFGGNNLGNTGTVELANLNGDNGFIINGIETYDRLSNYSISGGDFNGDGFSDVLLGTEFADSNGREYTGQSYLVFGGSNISDRGNIDLASLDGINGLIINGIDANDRSSDFVSNAGDINNDGIDDIIIGASFGDPDGLENAGEAYVIFGSNDLASNFNSSQTNSNLQDSIPGTNGVNTEPFEIDLTNSNNEETIALTTDLTEDLSLPNSAFDIDNLALSLTADNNDISALDLKFSEFNIDNQNSDLSSISLSTNSSF